MKKSDATTINESWPADELESVNTCPYCNTSQHTLAYESVQDWSFYCAPGKWTYWRCDNCSALYLSPRPTEASIGKAYAKYYTHSADGTSQFQRFKIKLKNECFFHWKNISIEPRLLFPKAFSFLFFPLKLFINPPFELGQLARPNKGKLLDVGCGSGNTLLSARQLGWDVVGLEIDSNAVKTAKQRGLNVLEGDFRQLRQFENQFDCIICSHVLEHVHYPLELLEMLTKALRPQGVLMLSLPNAKSHVLEEFGADWRGLEAPRHLGIPSLQKLTALLEGLGYESVHQTNTYNRTVAESIRIKNRQSKTSFKSSLQAILKLSLFGSDTNIQSDLIQITAKKK